MTKHPLKISPRWLRKCRNIRRLVSSLINCLIYQLIDFYWLTHWLLDWSNQWLIYTDMVNRLMYLLIDSLIDWRLIDWLIKDCLIDWILIDWLIDYIIDWLYRSWLSSQHISIWRRSVWKTTRLDGRKGEG